MPDIKSVAVRMCATPNRTMATLDCIHLAFFMSFLVNNADRFFRRRLNSRTVQCARRDVGRIPRSTRMNLLLVGQRLPDQPGTRLGRTTRVLRRFAQVPLPLIEPLSVGAGRISSLCGAKVVRLPGVLADPEAWCMPCQASHFSTRHAAAAARRFTVGPCGDDLRLRPRRTPEP